MKLYFHPASTTSRPIMLFAAENNIDLERQVVDLFTGEHYQPPYVEINPNRLVPVLEDGNFRLTESSAILKYLAEKIGSAAYPKDLQQRARVNERMDWVNTQLCRDLAYGFIYPQIFPTHKRRSDEAHEATLQWGKERAQGWLKVLNDNILGTTNNYLCGDTMTIADYFCASFVALCELTGSDLSEFPNVKRWLGRMKSLKTWQKVNEVIDGYGASLKGSPMQAV
ncbi:MAG TPA: glutathione S-transferase family protein [Burkholderiaceae bacterium]|nr:glutathione S-transferase family protein [Burkholderiaceae bacterium]